jgi:xylulokinase
MKTILVLDLGTTNIKAILYNEEGTVVAESSQFTPVTYCNNNMEISPEQLWIVSKKVCQDILQRIKNVKILAICISSMAASLIPIDGHGNPLHNAIGWADGRSLTKMNEFLDIYNSGYRIKDCGQYPLPMYAAFKIPWFNSEFKELKPKIIKWINVSDYIYSKFLGINSYYTEYSIASRTMLFDDVHKKWNQRALCKFGIEQDLLPDPFPSGTILGEIGEEACSIGFDKNTILILGGHDHMCASLGAAITEPGLILNSTGTSEAIITMLNKPYNIEQLPTYWINSESSLINDEIMGVAYTTVSGKIFQSISDMNKHSCNDKKNIFIDKFNNPICEPVFIPSLRAMLPSVYGAFINMPPNFNKYILAQSALEGINYECRRVCERMANVQGISMQTLRIVGGQTKNPVSLQTKANILGVPIETPKEIHISAKGAFIVAAHSCGIYNSSMEAANYLYSKVKKQIYYPSEDIHELYDEIYQNRYIPYFNNGIYSL